MSSSVALILARGGSKGVPKKNIIDLRGKPLIAWPIAEAIKCSNISNIYVSTDDPEIKEISESFGAKIINRPIELCQDSSTDLDSFKHAVKELASEEDLIHLRATTPLIKSDVLSNAINYFYSNNHCTSLRSAHESPETAYKSFKHDGIYWSGLFNDELNGEYYNLPRQNLPKTYHPNGYVDIVRPAQFMDSDSLHGNKILSFITEYAHEVDTLDDFKILEALHGKN